MSRKAEIFWLAAIFYAAITALTVAAGTATLDTLVSKRRVAATGILVYSFEIVDYLGKTFIHATIRDLLSSISRERGFLELERRLYLLFSLRWQVLFSSALGAATVPLIWIFLGGGSLKERVISTVVCSSCAFALMQGAYYAVFAPLITLVVARHSMRTYRLNPADTPWIHGLSTVFTANVVGQIFAAGLGLGGAYLFVSSDQTTAARWVTQLWLGLAVVIIFYSFVFPQCALAKVIRRYKSREMRKLQPRVARSLQRNSERLDGLTNAYALAVGSRGTAFDLQSLATVLGSLVLPVASFIWSIGRK